MAARSPLHLPCEAIMGKLKSIWSNPFIAVAAYSHVVVIRDEAKNNFTVNGQQLKHYFSGGIDRGMTQVCLRDLDL